jgi:glucose-1-phosphate thymidylyltransferase
MLEASNFVAAIEKRQGFKIAAPEEVALRQGFIGVGDLQRLIAQRYANSDYGRYLAAILADLS